MMPPINEAVAFMISRAPARIDKLRERFPNESGLFELGITAGETTAFVPSEGAEKIEPVPAALKARACAVGSALEEAWAQADRARVDVRAQLKRADLWEFVGELSTVISSSTLFALLLPTDPKLLVPRLITAGITLLSALLAMLSRWLRKPTPGVSGTLVEYYQQLTELIASATGVAEELKYWEESAPPARLHEIIGRGSALLRKAIELLPPAK